MSINPIYLSNQSPLDIASGVVAHAEANRSAGDEVEL